MLKTKEVRDQSIDELKALHQDLCKEIYELMNESRMTRKMEKPHLVREKKRDRARVKTILREKGERV